MNRQQATVRDVLARLTGRPAHTINGPDRLSDLGLDSLDRLTVAVFVEELSGRPLSDETLAGLATVADLDRHVAPERSPA